ncbi:hypothetical protein KQI82_04540 [Oscillibacter sp. MSJ-2]|uniref:DUF2225 domain-containing protein n=1 Tax=Dysosmobacter acutus TaxID=2841504 RepID=A0ABS6F7E6_9FIRM|nr:hypothetical protein [Dysosmobacter acutus]MBU5626190.1 hypothetical protein [Dysosmobacter acutus]
MARYRCAACGSPNVVKDSQAGGVSYNYKKGIIGAVVLGTGGAVAGIENKTQLVYRCPDCGLTMTYPMDEAEKLAIDAGVQSAAARDRLTVYGISVPWNYFTKKYVNIESGAADEETKANEAHSVKMKEISTQTMRIVADSIIEDYQILQAEAALLEKDEYDFEGRQAAWEAVSKSVLDARRNEYEQAEQKILSQLREEVEKAKKELEDKIEHAKNSHETMLAEKTALVEEQSGLGLFKGKRKKEIAQRLQELEATMAANDLVRNTAEQSFVNAEKEITEKANSNIAAEKAKIDEKYPLEESPADHREKVLKKKAYLDDIRENGGYTAKQKAARYIATYKFIEFVTVGSKNPVAFSLLTNERDISGDFETYPASDIVEVYEMLKEKLSEILASDVSSLGFFNEQTVAAALKELTDAGVLNLVTIKYKRYYSIQR